MKYIEDFERFRGTGALNNLGEDLETFLENYNPAQYPAPFNTTDIIVFKTPDKLGKWKDTKFKVLLIKRGNHPCIGMWAVPGGFVDLRENLEIGAARELEEETGISGLPLVQLRAWGDYDRDPRWRLITTAFMSIVEGEQEAKAGDDAAEADWFEVELSGKTVSHVSYSEEQICCDGNYSSENEPKTCVTDYTLKLTNDRTGEVVGSVVRVTTTRHPVIPSRSYELISSDNMAADHGCLIVDALLYLKDRM